MASVWSLPASLRIVVFIFLMVALAFLLFAITFVTNAKRGKVVIAYLISLFVALFLDVVLRTPVLYGLDAMVCDYLTLAHIVPIVLSIILFFKNRHPLLLLDAVYLLFSIALFGFIPYYGYIVSAFTLYIVPRAALIFFMSQDDKKKYPGRMAIKYALDELSQGIIFANAFHQIIYINKAMKDVLSSLGIPSFDKVTVIASLLRGKAFRHITPDDFILNVNGDSYRFVLNESLTQITCFDVTVEETLLKQEEANKERLFSLNKELNERLSKANQIQEEKELLSLRGYIHDSLAQKLSIIHMLLLNGKSIDLKEIKAMLLELRLNKDEAKEDELSYLVTLLREIGIELQIEGNLPSEEKAQALFIKAIKECTTNAIRHGAAKQIKATIGENFLEISNDGLAQGKVNYGNGLSGIKIEAEQLGYSLRIDAKSPFKVQISRG